MTILQAVAAGLENTEKRKEPKKKSTRYFLDGKVADRELKACNLCKIVWQKHVFNGKTKFGGVAFQVFSNYKPFSWPCKD